MKLILDGHGEKFAVEQILVVLFPGEKPEYVSEPPECGNWARVSLRETEKRITARTELSRDGKLGAAESRTARVPDCADEQEHKRRVRQVIRTSFFKAARDACGLRPEWGAMTGIRPAKVAAKMMEEGLDDGRIDQLLRDRYFVRKKRRELCIQVARAGLCAKQGATPLDASVYVGIPFCASRCKYCSFVSHSIGRAAHLVEPYLDALELEIRETGRAARELGLAIKSVYIGGGTPTALTAPQLARVMEALRREFDLEHVREYTVEAGRPDTADLEKIRVIRDLGATRVSVNPQTMNDRVLEAMGRNHTAEDIRRMYDQVRQVGGLAVNMDVIAGLPGDTLLGFQNTIRELLALRPENLTVHTLAVKKGSTLREEGMGLPDGECASAMVEYAAGALRRAGYAPYYLYRQKYMSGNLENVGYTLPGFEGLYNIYIMDEIHTILSLGAGGVTKLVDRSGNRIARVFNLKYPYEYNKDTERIMNNARKIREFYRKDCKSSG